MPIPPNIPWDQVLRHGPKVLQTATALFDKWQARRPEPVDPNAEMRVQVAAIVARLQALEETEATQSEVIRNMARQIEGLSAGLAEMSQKIRLARALAGVATLVAIGAWVAWFLR